MLYEVITAYDTVTLNGEVTAIDDGLITVKIVGSNSLGDHVVATATLVMGGLCVITSYSIHYTKLYDHDRDKAQAKGSKDIFVNILTDTGLVQRFVTDWAGPTAVIRSIGLRLGVPWYAYDTVT